MNSARTQSRRNFLATSASGIGALALAPAPLPDQGQSLVMWKCRVQQLGDFPIRIRSTNGVTTLVNVTIKGSAS